MKSNLHLSLWIAIQNGWIRCIKSSVSSSRTWIPRVKSGVQDFRGPIYILVEWLIDALPCINNRMTFFNLFWPLYFNLGAELQSGGFRAGPTHTASPFHEGFKKRTLPLLYPAVCLSVTLICKDLECLGPPFQNSFRLISTFRFNKAAVAHFIHELW